MKLLTLVKNDAAKIAAHNNFLKTFHHKQLANGWVFVVDSMPDLPQPAFWADFIFANKYELKLVSPALPFLEVIEEWCKPWKWHELSPDLSFLVLDEILNIHSQKLPDNLRLNGFSTTQVSEDKNLMRFSCNIKKDNNKYQLDLWVKENFPWSELGEALSLAPIAAPNYPESLQLKLPIKLTSTILPAKILKALIVGDIIIIQPAASNDHST